MQWCFGQFSLWLDDTIGNVYAVNLIIGTLSAIVDNVPLVAGAIGMYPVASDAMVATAADPAYIANFVQDGVFWQFLAYCAGVGGSMLIIGSAAGVVVMGLEGINFIWYLKESRCSHWPAICREPLFTSYKMYY